MFKFLTKKRTQQQQRQLADWVKRAKKTNDPLKLTDLLLSDWPFVNKAKVLFSLPLNAIHDKTGVRLLESQLEEFGYVQLAQVVRWLEFCNLPKKRLEKDLEWSKCIIQGDIMIRWIVQRETYAQEETRALQKSLALEEVDDKTEGEAVAGTAKLKKYKAELRCLNDGYWEMSHAAYLLEAEISDGVLKRAFKQCRADPEWYLCQWLREDCARRGGCCGRGCGCCEKARTNNRQWNRGHCTRACGCCVRKQQRSDKSVFWDGYEIDEVDIVSMDSPYGARLIRAYIWGLNVLDELNLFE